MTLSALIIDFLEYLELEKNASQLTIKNYDHYLKRFLSFAGDIDPKEIDLNLVRKYRFFLSKKPLKRVTQNYFMIALRAFLKYLKMVDIQTFSWENVKLRDWEVRPLKVLTTEPLIALLEAPDTGKIIGLRDRAILETLFSTGLRVSELVALNRGEFTCFWVEKYLSKRKDYFKPLFIRFQGEVTYENGGEAMRLTPRSIERIVEKYAKKLSFSPRPTPHSFRYHFISSQASPHPSAKMKALLLQLPTLLLPELLLSSHQD